MLSILIFARFQIVSIISITYSPEARLMRYRFAMIPNFVEVERIFASVSISKNYANMKL
jgi:hypothetical protein